MSTPTPTTSPDSHSAHPRRRVVGTFLAVLAVVFIAVGCETAPLDNTQGTSAGLAPTPSKDLAKARALIVKVKQGNPSSSPAYDRAQFGTAWTDAQDATWGRNKCDTRNDILNRDLTDTTLGSVSGCANRGVLKGTLHDPYKDSTIHFVRGTGTSTAVQIDHVFPLSAAWKMGASSWTAAKRKNFANDPLNLLAVDGPSNTSKSDKLPSAWMPANKKVDCSYSVRLAQVSIRYSLPVTGADVMYMLSSCTG